MAEKSEKELEKKNLKLLSLKKNIKLLGQKKKIR